MKATKTKQKPPLHVTLSALEQRAQREGWSDADRANRASRAQALRTFHGHYKAAAPGTSWHMIRLVKIDMMQATADCKALDSQLAKKGFEPIYVKALATFHSKKALDALHFRACEQFREMSAGKKPQSKARATGDYEQSAAKSMLHRIKEQMRDGNTCAEALKHESGMIQLMATHGSTAFFISLGSLLSEAKRKKDKYSKRTLCGWIVKRWLPLRLWECPENGRTAHERFTQAAKLLNKEAPSYTEFLKAWRNVRSRAMKAAVEYAQKAKAD